MSINAMTQLSGDADLRRTAGPIAQTPWCAAEAVSTPRSGDLAVRARAANPFLDHTSGKRGATGVTSSFAGTPLPAHRSGETSPTG